MTVNTTPVDGNDFYDGFQWIADNLSDGAVYHIALLGSGAANVYFSNCVISNDFDVIDIDNDFLSDEMKQLIAMYASNHGFGHDWINDSISVYGTASEHRSGMYEIQEVIEFVGENNDAHIFVEMPTPEFILYRKLMIHRNKDLISAALLGPAMGLNTVKLTGLESRAS